MEQNPLESKEQQAVTTEILTTPELQEVIYGDEILPQDKRFFSSDEGGVFKYFSPEDVVGHKAKNSERVFPVVKEGEKIVGISMLKKNPYEENTYIISFVSVDSAYQGKGYATKLLKEIFEYAKEAGITLEASSYTTDGWLKLKEKVQYLANETGVHLQDEQTRM